MLNKNSILFTILIPVILGVILAIMYDVLQDVWLWSFTQQHIGGSSLSLEVGSKIASGSITILFGLLIILIAYRKYFQ